MLEAAIAVGAICFFWLVATIAFDKKLSAERRVCLIFLAAGLVYLLIRLIRWAWGTTLPFVGG
jgi:hypothetical protein